MTKREVSNLSLMPFGGFDKVFWQALAEQSRIVRLPLNKVGLTNRINKAVSKLEQDLGRAPSSDELAQLLDMNREDIEATLSSAARHVSMDAPFSSGEENKLLDVLVNPNATMADTALAHNESLSAELERSLSSLTDRQKNVLKLFFGIGTDHPLSLEDIGVRFSLTRERVRQIKDKAILKLRTTSRSSQLKNYLGA